MILFLHVFLPRMLSGRGRAPPPATLLLPSAVPSSSWHRGLPMMSERRPCCRRFTSSANGRCCSSALLSSILLAEDPHQEEALGKAYDARLMRRLVRYVSPYRRQMAHAVALIVLSSVLELVGPLATAVALDLFVQPAGGGKVSGLSRWVAE